MAQTTQQELIAQLIKNGATKTSVQVKRAQVTILSTWTRLRLEVDTQVDAYISDDEGNYKLGKDNVVFLSLYNLVNALRNDDLDVLIDHLLEHPKALTILLKNAKLSLVERKVSVGDTIDGVVADHDAIYWYCDGITFSDAAKTHIDRVIDDILGI